MKLTNTVVLTSIAALFAMTATSVADFNSHFGFNVQDGRLTTEDWVSGTGYLGESQIFAFQSQDDGVGGEFFDLGTNSVPDTFAYPGAIGFNFLSQLSVWNGGGFSAVSDTFTVQFGPAAATSSTGFVEGFGTAVRSPQTGHPEGQWGRHHIHYDGFINGMTGDGLYMIEMRFWYEPTGDNTVTYLDSDPVFVLLSLNADDQLADARSYLEAQLPAPGALALVALGGLASVRRRRSN